MTLKHKVVKFPLPISDDLWAEQKRFGSRDKMSFPAFTERLDALATEGWILVSTWTAEWDREVYVHAIFQKEFV